MTIKYHDKIYLELLQYILDNGIQKGDRTGTGTLSTFAYQMRFDLSNNSIPLLTTKKMFYKGIIHELLWFLSGSTNIKYLTDNNVHIWDAWTDEQENVGPSYGYLWKSWPTKTGHIDQISTVIDQLRTTPNDRRIIISAWNPEFLPDNSKSFSENIANEKQGLPPCHCFIQFWVDGDNGLSCHLYQRSCDSFLGVPFNIAQYSILVHMIAQVTGMKAKEFIWTGGDTHIYNNHFEQCKEQLSRTALPSPTLSLNSNITEIDDFKFSDFKILNYNSCTTIKAPVST